VDGFNLSTIDEALDLCEGILLIAESALKQSHCMATASAQFRGLQPKSIASLANYIEHVEQNQKVVANLQSTVANTKALRSALATVEASTQ
jgi:hypothetical protein